MKTKMVVILSLIVFMMTSFAVAADQETAADKKKAQSRAAKEKMKDAVSSSPRDRTQSTAARSQMYREIQAKQSEKHRASLDELRAIKKVAEEEGATQTVAAIQALIDKKDAEFKADLERLEKSRRDRAERLEKRQVKGSGEQTTDAK